MDEKEAQILNVQYRFYDFTDIHLEKCIDGVYDECAAGLIYYKVPDTIKFLCMMNIIISLIRMGTNLQQK